MARKIKETGIYDMGPRQPIRQPGRQPRGGQPGMPGGGMVTTMGKGMPPKGMGPGMHKMPGGMMMKDEEMKAMMKKGKKGKK